MCCLFERPTKCFSEDNFSIYKIFLYKVYLQNSKIRHDKDIVRRLVICKNCGSMFIQQVTEKETRYIEVKSEKEADKLIKKLPDDNFVSNKHNMIIVEESDGCKAITYLS